MNIKFQPRDFGIWLDIIDVNCLNAADADRLAAFDIDDDFDLERLIVEWIKPRFDENDAQNRNEMKAILEQSKQWTTTQLQPVFAEVGIPSGQEVNDIDRFMDALRRQILV